MILDEQNETVIRFWSKVHKGDGCWIWKAAKKGEGYGNFRNGPHTVAAHRFSWETKNGEIPPGLCVLHKCDNPPCVNPDHLFLGTRQDNNADKMAKGRCSNWRTRSDKKLTPEQAREIREVYATGTYTTRELGKIFGVSGVTVFEIVKNRSWVGA